MYFHNRLFLFSMIRIFFLLLLFQPRLVNFRLEHSHTFFYNFEKTRPHLYCMQLFHISVNLIYMQVSLLKETTNTQPHRQLKRSLL